MESQRAHTEAQMQRKPGKNLESQGAQGNLPMGLSMQMSTLLAVQTWYLMVLTLAVSDDKPFATDGCE